MKKILIALIAVLSVVSASAQFGVVNKPSTTYEVYPMRAGVSLRYVKRDGASHYYLALNTSNQFAKPILIWLGDKEQARASLSQLLNELWEIGKMYTLTDNTGEKFYVVGAKTFGAEGYEVYKDGHAGHAYIRLKQITEMLELM